MKILALDGALARCSAAVLDDATLLAERSTEAGRGHAALLPPLAERVLHEAGIPATALDAVAVTVGPGSFTGLRAAISLAHGIAQAIGRPVVGVTVAEALAADLPKLAGRTLLVAIDSRRNRVFLDDGAGPVATGLDGLPQPRGPVAIAGDGAIAVAARLAACGADVMLTAARLPRAACVAAVARRRLAGELPPLAALPLYVDPPEAKLPAGGLRPPPQIATMSVA